MVEAATQCVDALKYCYADDDEALWRDIMLKCVAVNGLSLRHAVRRGETFCTDKEIVVAACKEDGLALAFAPAMLQTDAEASWPLCNGTVWPSSTQAPTASDSS